MGRIANTGTPDNPLPDNRLPDLRQYEARGQYQFRPRPVTQAELRRQAREAGHVRYVGRPCCRGHDHGRGWVNRRTADGRCCQCRAEDFRRYLLLDD